jgi:hypothetical protein
MDFKVLKMMKKRSVRHNIQNATAKMLTNAINGAMQNICLKKTLTVDSYSITEICLHDIAEIIVIHSVCTCETTVLVCTQCGEQLTQPKTEC